jgi:hypothetical protein
VCTAQPGHACRPRRDDGVTPNSGGQWISEGVATFDLLLTILLGACHRPRALPALVACYIAAAYWFTASTSFANPAVTLARSLTRTFAGIRPEDVPGFLLAQTAGALLAWSVARVLLPRDRPWKQRHACRERAPVLICNSSIGVVAARDFSMSHHQRRGDDSMVSEMIPICA